MTDTIATGTNRRFHHTATTTGTAADVWRLWTDVSLWKRWDTGLADATIDGPFEQGAVGTIIPKRGRDAGFTVTDLDPGVAYTFATDLPGARLCIRRDFVEGPATTFRHIVWFEGATARIWAAVLGRGFRRELPAAMAILSERASAGDA